MMFACSPSADHRATQPHPQQERPESSVRANVGGSETDEMLNVPVALEPKHKP